VLYFDPTFALENAQSRIFEALKDFVFWFGDVETNERFAAMRRVTFWSENHIFMHLSSAHLLSQYASARYITRTSVTDKEESLLRCYLSGHADFEGVYEVLSSTYLPFTMYALLNLYDFSSDSVLKAQADKVLQCVVSMILRSTSSRGECTLTCRARQYPRARLRNWDHSINGLVRLCTGVDIDPEMALTTLEDFLCTSTWRPSEATLNTFHFSGFYSRLMSHPKSEMSRYYNIPTLSPIEMVPFHW
jgi:hypothetical protein